VDDLRLVPDLVGRCLDREEEVLKSGARALKDMQHCLYLGRGINMPIAYEGALKLKEISYIHAEGYPAGEMKHGPIALIDKDMPVVVLAPRDPWYDKMISQIEQAKARAAARWWLWQPTATRPDSPAWPTTCCGCPRPPGCSARS
jgi:glutamine---fructose-6-phosphate transaminase (isomerizing)